jgi:hypothetical protein
VSRQVQPGKHGYLQCNAEASIRGDMLYNISQLPDKISKKWLCKEIGLRLFVGKIRKNADPRFRRKRLQATHPHQVMINPYWPAFRVDFAA